MTTPTVYRVRCLDGCGVLAWTATALLAARIGNEHEVRKDHNTSINAEAAGRPVSA